jgi:hypothetical protein
MKKNNVGKGLMLVGSLRKAGITTYMKQGQMITRVSYSYQKRSNTLPQFIQRQKMRHTIALWKMLKFCDVMFTQRPTAYQNFASLANRLPAVYVERVRMNMASFLMPGIPVSDGTLPTIQLQLGEVNGTPALLTNLSNDERTYRTTFRLYTAVQTVEIGYIPQVRFSMREVRCSEMTAVDGRMALVGEEFGDDMKGWALVRVIDDRCSTQGIVTRCTLYEQYTTDEALQAAAKSYGGMTKTPFLSSR